MPQLDKTIIFSQLFWLFIILFLFYFLLSFIFLPKFLQALKARKYVMEENNKKNLYFIKNLSEKNKIYGRELNGFLNSTKVNFYNLERILKKQDVNLSKIDYKLSSTIIKIQSCCNLTLLSNISFFPKILNLGKKLS